MDCDVLVGGVCETDTGVEDDSLAGTGGITGLANWASKELTKPKLGARTLITLRAGKTAGVEGDVDDVEDATLQRVLLLVF